MTTGSFGIPERANDVEKLGAGGWGFLALADCRDGPTNWVAQDVMRKVEEVGGM
jgi:hypothetical protein